MSTDSVLVSSLVLPVSLLPVPLPIRTEDCTECLCDTTMEQSERGKIINTHCEFSEGYNCNALHV